MRKALALLGLPLLAACGSAGEPDSGTNPQVQLAQEDVQRLQGICTAPQTYARLKEIAFDQAAKRRAGEASALDRAAAGARAEMAGPVTASGQPSGVVVCSGRFLLEVPGEEGPQPLQLAAQIEYAAQAAPDGSGLVFEVEGAEQMVGRLALLGGALPQGSLAPSPAPRSDAPYDGEHRALHSTGPSFDCTRTRFPTEAMICSSRPLSALDREMASLYYDRLARADERTRQLLRRSRDGFLARRDRCQEGGCIASVYEDRIAEIRRISTRG
jgi:hypothetical protein